MTYPDSPQVTTADGLVLMIALATLGRFDQSGQLPPVQAGEAFFVRERETAGLVRPQNDRRHDLVRPPLG